MGFQIPGDPVFKTCSQISCCSHAYWMLAYRRGTVFQYKCFTLSKIQIRGGSYLARMWNISIENFFQKGCSSSHLRPDQPLLGLDDSQGTDFSPSAPWGVSIPSSDALIGDRAGCDHACIWWHSVCPALNNPALGLLWCSKSSSFRTTHSGLLGLWIGQTTFWILPGRQDALC